MLYEWLKLTSKTGNIKKMITKIKKLFYLLGFQSIFLLLMPRVAMAAACTSGYDCLSSGKPGEVMNLLNVGLNVLAAFVAAGATIMLIVGGIQYITSNGNPQAVTKAKQRVVDVIIGLFAFIFLYAFLQWLIPGGSSIF